MIQDNHKFIQMTLRIVTTNEELAREVIKILQYYFPTDPKGLTSLNDPTICINTKYYSCVILIQICKFDHPPPAELGKVDTLLFLFQKSELVQDIAPGVDRWMDTLKPESAMVCVHGNHDHAWRYEQEINSCENFVSLIYEDVDLVAKNLPKWVISSSLLEQKSQDIEFFSFLELLETTSWSGAENKQNQGKKSEGDNMQRQGQEQLKEEKKEEEGQMSEEALQNEMIQFEALMQQMMEVKTMITSDNERKQKAENLIRKLAKTFGE